MNKKEEVKIILQQFYIDKKSPWDAEDSTKFACQIYQLFEPKPDENRLLTMNEWLDNHGIDSAYKKDMKPTWDKILQDLLDQDAKTAGIKDKECQQRIDKIRREIESCHAANIYTIADKKWLEIWRE